MPVSVRRYLDTGRYFRLEAESRLAKEEMAR